MARWRHLLVTILLVPALVIYLAVAMLLADVLTGYHMVFDFVFYLVVGLAWIPGAAVVIGWLAKYEAE